MASPLHASSSTFKNINDLQISPAGNVYEVPDYTINNPLAPIYGVPNYGPRHMKVITAWKKKLGNIFEKYGYCPMDPRPVEFAHNLQRTNGSTKVLYGVNRLTDNKLTKLGLPFDKTASLAIMAAQQHSTITFPYARYDIGWAFRGEHAITGRCHTFVQCDVDIIDKALTASSDAQCIVAIIKGLQSLGVQNCNVFLNHLGIARAFMRKEGIHSDHYTDVLRTIDKLKPNKNEAEIVKELCEKAPELTPERAQNLLSKISYRGPLSGFKFSNDPGQEAWEAYHHLCEVESIAVLMGIPKEMLQFGPNLTRGLNYYTGVVFETFISGKEKYGSIASGGRYDDLIPSLDANVKLQGMGGSIGLTRLFDVMQAENLLDLSKQTVAQVFVGYGNKNCLQKAINVANSMREMGINTEFHTSERPVEDQIKLANDKGIPYSLILMNENDIILNRNESSSEGNAVPNSFSSANEAAVYLKEILAKESREKHS